MTNIIVYHNKKTTTMGPYHWKPFFFFTLAHKPSRSSAETSWTARLCRMLVPTFFSLSVTWGQTCRPVWWLPSLPWFPPNFLSHRKYSLCTLRLLLASASRRTRIPTQGEWSSFADSRVHARPLRGHSQNNYQDTRSHSRLTHSKKAFIEFNFRKHRHLRPFW